ncbi:MAG: septal ring lytic transglycosylase RlpA family protein [Treponema sp.]|jgi:rare lipoprotein A|nr:septal ring lytic transglycosylase RlpA family protein [Treponema sp.]
MKKKFIFIALITVALINLSAQAADVFKQEGIASWYGKEYDGRPTASGEIYDSSGLTAAHPSLPFGTRLVVTNQHNNKSVTVRVNDRGPFVPSRIIDVSRAAAEQLDMITTGTAPVSIESIDRIAISPPVQQVPSAQQTPPAQQVMPVQQAVPVIQAQTVPVTPHSTPVAAQPIVIQPVVTQIPMQINLTPAIVVVPEKTYRLQVGSYKNARNAVTAFDRIKNAGLNPAYERYMDGTDSEYFRVVVAGVRGADVQQTAEKLGNAGFREALIREEN